MIAWLVLVTIGVGTFALRVSMFILLGERTLPSWTASPLAYVAPAAIAALVAAMVLTDGGRIDVAPTPELTAVVGGFLATRRTGNVMHAIGVGVPLFWASSLIVG